jgi:hypothetical protein
MSLIPIPRLLLTAVLSAAAGPIVRSQDANSSSVASADSWPDLLRSTLAASSATIGGTIAMARTSVAGSPSAGIAADYLARAAALSAFCSSHASDPRAPEGRRLEAEMLLYAEYYGDTSSAGRCAALVRLVRADPTVAAEARFSLAAMADYQPSRFQAYSSDDLRAADQEKIARALLSEFPNVAASYEGLWRVANDSPDNSAVRIAGDLIQMDAAPAAVKAAAQLLLSRHALVGQSLSSILKKTLAVGAASPVTLGKAIVLYSWRSANYGTLQMAAAVAAQVPIGVTVIGVNLDTDAAVGRKTAAAQSLPGVQLYDSAGLDSKTAQALLLRDDIMVIVADGTGTITSVSGRLNLAAKIEGARK